MKHVTLDLGNGGAAAQGLLYEPTPKMPQRMERPCVIVIPGGAYAYRSAREADPVAAQFSAAGYNTFVLEYTTAGEDGSRGPLKMRPLMEVAEAVATVRERAAEWGVDPERIAVCGFSAGGHLAASLGVHWGSEKLPYGRACRPDAMILSYPVITSDPAYFHGGSIENLCGDDEDLRAFFSLEKQVTKETVPAYLWHTVTDESVPVENSMLFISALQKNGVPFECHLFAAGEHGMSICTQGVDSSDRHNAAWVPLSIEWLDERFHFVRS